MDSKQSKQVRTKQYRRSQATIGRHVTVFETHFLFWQPMLDTPPLLTDPLLPNPSTGPRSGFRTGRQAPEITSSDPYAPHRMKLLVDILTAQLIYIGPVADELQTHHENLNFANQQCAPTTLKVVSC